jgi:hypothetical protein
VSQVYVSVQPTTGTGRLIWHSLGAKTIELIHQNVHVDAVRDDLDKIVLDAELLEAVLGTPDPKKKSRELEIKISKRLRQHQGNPAYKTLSERLEALKERHEQGQLHSVQFLKELLVGLVVAQRILRHSDGSLRPARSRQILTDGCRRTPARRGSESYWPRQRFVEVFEAPIGRSSSGDPTRALGPIGSICVARILSQGSASVRP